MLILLLSSGSKNEVVVGGSRAKPVHCEACDRPFAYELTREAAGKDTSLFSWTEAAARRKAHANARENLEKALADGVDPAPCPHCGWVQQHMVEHVRRHSYASLYELAKLSFLLGAACTIVLVCFLVVVAAGGAKALAANAEPLALGAAVVAVLAAPGVLIWGLRSALKGAYDPNRGRHLLRDDRA